MGDPAALDLMKRFKIRMPSQGLNVEEMTSLLRYLETSSVTALPDGAKLGALAR